MRRSGAHRRTHTSHAVKKFTGDGGRRNIIVKIVLLGAVASVSYPPFPPSGSVLLVLPHCLELAIPMTRSE